MIPNNYYHGRLLGGNTKTIKAGASTAGQLAEIGLSLASSTEAGIVLRSGKTFSACTSSTASCRTACTGFHGGQNALPSAQEAKVAKTLFFWHHPAAFRARLCAELFDFEQACKAAGAEPIVRLNLSTDLPWHGSPHPEAPGACDRIPQEFPAITFGEYTAHAPSRIGWRPEDIPQNMRVTYSRKNSLRDRHAAESLAIGRPVAIVFTDGSSCNRAAYRLTLPDSWTIGGVTAPVVDGDIHDAHWLTAAAQGITNGRYIIGLRAKNRSRKGIADMLKSGFAVLIPPQ